MRIKQKESRYKYGLIPFTEAPRIVKFKKTEKYKWLPDAGRRGEWEVVVRVLSPPLRKMKSPGNEVL